MYVLFLASLHGLFVILATAFFLSRMALYLSAAVAFLVAVNIGGAEYVFADVLGVVIGFSLAKTLVADKTLVITNFWKGIFICGISILVLLLILQYFIYQRSLKDNEFITEPEKEIVGNSNNKIRLPVSPTTFPTQKQMETSKKRIEIKRSVNSAEPSKCFMHTTDAEILACLDAEN